MPEIEVTRLRSRQVVDPVAPPQSIVRRALGIVTGIDRGDMLVLVGLGLVGAGTWQFSPPGAAVAVGVVVLWYAMPSRPPFIGGSH